MTPERLAEIEARFATFEEWDGAESRLNAFAIGYGDRPVLAITDDMRELLDALRAEQSALEEVKSSAYGMAEELSTLRAALKAAQTENRQQFEAGRVFGVRQVNAYILQNETHPGRAHEFHLVDRINQALLATTPAMETEPDNA